MTRWQRRARLVIAVFAVVFAAFVCAAVPAPRPAAGAAPVARTDPRPSSKAPAGESIRFKRSREDVSVALRAAAHLPRRLHQAARRHDRHRRARRRPHLHHHRQGRDSVGQNESTIALDGDVRLAGSDGMTVRDRARDLRGQRRHRARARAGRVLARPDDGTGVGMTYDKNARRPRRSSIRRSCTSRRMRTGRRRRRRHAPGRPTFARRDKYIRFERAVQDSARRPDRSRPTRRSRYLERRREADRDAGAARATRASRARSRPPAALQALSGRDMDLKYGADGERSSTR